MISKRTNCSLTEVRTMNSLHEQTGMLILMDTHLGVNLMVGTIVLLAIHLFHSSATRNPGG